MNVVKKTSGIPACRLPVIFPGGSLIEDTSGNVYLLSHRGYDGAYGAYGLQLYPKSEDNSFRSLNARGSAFHAFTGTLVLSN